jgi:prepilin-type N-terminal cleavage/methylation domain-containing protein
MSPSEKNGKRAWIMRQDGFSMLEMLITLFILLSVAGIVMAAMMQMTNTQGTVANRTAMHSSIRSATELLQQEIGQAGRIALPTAANGGPTKMTTTITAGPTGNIVNTDTGYTGAVSLDAVAGVYNGMLLVVDSGDQEETVAVTNLVSATKTFTGTFFLPHAAPVPVRVVGAFSSGIVPKGATNGSTDWLLKLYGDINDDGNMEYIEYHCDTAGHNLYRNAMSFTAASKPAETISMIILPNILDNPADPGVPGVPAPCFKYQQQTVTPNTYVTDVSVTLTVQTQNLDPQTHIVQKETKALLNVSPRNIFEGWQLGGGGVKNRIQPIPPTVTSLLP